MFDTGVLPEDFPALGLMQGDMLCYRTVTGEGAVPENQPVIVRNIHNGKLSVGYIEGSTLYLATQTIRRYQDWGAEVAAVVTATHRNWWPSKM